MRRIPLPQAGKDIRSRQLCLGALCGIPHRRKASTHECPDRFRSPDRTLCTDLISLGFLAYSKMPPEHFEDAMETGGNRVEQFANNFAAEALMPARTLEQLRNWSNLTEETLIAQLNVVADELHVTSSALRWRLVALGELKSSVARSLPEEALRNNGRDAVESELPALFSRPFVEVLGLAIDKGHVSIRRVASLLELTVEDLADLFTAHNVSNPVDL